MQNITGRPASTFFIGDAKLNELCEIAVGGVAGNGKPLFTFLTGEFFAFDQQSRHLPLPLVQLLLDGRRHGSPGLAGGHAKPFQVVSWSGKDDLEIAGVGCQTRLFKAVVNHPVVHPSEATASFLDAMKE
jgi:hypothetical protein